MDQPSLYADVLLPLSLPVLYTYRIPDTFRKRIKPGMRVSVQFGPKRIYAALVKEVHTRKPGSHTTKDILSILDESPVVLEIQYRFWEWIAGYYLCAEGEVMKAALPSGLRLESESKVYPDPDFQCIESLSDDASRLLRIIDKNGVSINEITRGKSKKSGVALINELILKRAIFTEEQLMERYQPKRVAYIKLDPDMTEDKLNDILDNLTRAPRQQEMILKFVDKTTVFSDSGVRELERATFLRESNGSAAALNALVKKGIMVQYRKEIGRLTHAVETGSANLKKLTSVQDSILHEIKASHEVNDVALLHGVTSSGKTEIYMHLVDEQLKSGRQVLYLLPEIALTTQIIQRLQRVFGSAVGVYHSRLNDAERVEIWLNVLQKEEKDAFRIILGARSALFLPFSNLGLIIVDEEHENTYKQQDPAPRYHARDAAIMLAQMHSARVVLGTATPSLESYYNAKTGKFGFVELKERFEKLDLPEIIIADLHEAYRKRVIRSHFTPQLMNAIEEALEKNEQVLLFQNRRGFSPFIECEECGFIPRCKHCAVSMTYHREMNRLVCHYCGYSYDNPGTCSNCGSPMIKTKGFGTEKIEKEIAHYFPEARIARMDLDTTRKKMSYERIIHDFEQRKIQILVGTQMISKGLDFKNVYVVGILNADNMLNFPDFRAYERSYQLMSQVSGRAGRTKKQGKVIVQTSKPDHPIIRDVVRHDYDHMFRDQLKERKSFSYPPYSRLIRISLKHYDSAKLDRASLELARRLREVLGMRILGPEAPIVNRIQRKYIKIILIKIEKSKKSTQFKGMVMDCIREFEQLVSYRSVQVIVDVDPM